MIITSLVFDQADLKIVHFVKLNCVRQLQDLIIKLQSKYPAEAAWIFSFRRIRTSRFQPNLAIFGVIFSEPMLQKLSKSLVQPIVKSLHTTQLRHLASHAFLMVHPSCLGKIVHSAFLTRLPTVVVVMMMIDIMSMYLWCNLSTVCLIELKLNSKNRRVKIGVWTLNQNGKYTSSYLAFCFIYYLYEKSLDGFYLTASSDLPEIFADICFWSCIVAC